MLFHSCLEMTNNDSHFENDNNDSQFENDNNDSQFACTNSNNHVTGKHTGKAKKKKNLGSIIQLLSSPVKHTFKRNLANSVVTEVIVNADSENIHEATVVSSIITYLKELNRKVQ